MTDTERLRAVVEETRSRGYGLVDQELEDGLRSVAVPIVDGRGVTFAAVNVSAHSSRVSLEELRTRYLGALHGGRREDQCRPARGRHRRGAHPAALRMADMQTQVGIVGAGPAGLVLSHLLHRFGIDNVVLEQRSRDYVEHRVRAGVLEQGSADLLVATGVGERLLAEGAVHEGVNLQFDGERHRIDFAELAGGRTITVYGQQEVVKDLIAARLAAGGTVLFEAEAVEPRDVIAGDRPTIAFRHEGRDHELVCEVVAGCDGFHGVCRGAIPPGVLSEFEREYPFGWLGILAEVAPSTDELIYAFHERGFALHSLRSPEISRLYIQVDPDDDIARWPDERIWEELQVRLASPGWTLHEGPIIEKGITAMRSYVCEPMQHGNLFLAGDAAHIVPPTGAKGMNLAIADVSRAGWRARRLVRERADRDGPRRLLGAVPRPGLARAGLLEHHDRAHAPAARR